MYPRSLALLMVLTACSGDETHGTLGATDSGATQDMVATVADSVLVDTAVTGEPTDIAPPADTSPETVAPDTSADSLTPPDTQVDDDVEVVTTTCGDGTVEGDEACDDGDECKADGCFACGFEPAVVLVELALDANVGWDLDDADGDHDAGTGTDNRMAATDVVRAAVNGYISDYIASGELVQLAVLGDVQSLGDDPEVQLALFGGRDRSCPATSPPPWLDAIDVPIARDPADFDQCIVKTLVDDQDDPDNGIHAETRSHAPAPPWLRAWAPVIDLPVGPLGLLKIARARFEAHLAIADGALTGFEDGRLGGVIPASALARIDTSALLPRCPTALHAVLGLTGHIDQDAEGNGTKDFIQWTAGQGIPCITATVAISGCCDDGDCTSPIAGPDCVFDPRIGDGFSAGFRVRANAVHVSGPADACTP